jgi:hypothetical protein
LFIRAFYSAGMEEMKSRWFLTGMLCLCSVSIVLPSTAAAKHAERDNSPSTKIVLQGDVGGGQNNTYVEVPFRLPEGVQRVTISFHYTEKDKHTALDLGLMDTSRLRCWSGGNKTVLTIGLSDATPSCLPGPLPAGTWNILIGVPNIRAGVTSHYTAEVYFSRSGLVSQEPEVLRAPLRPEPAWYRGDLHMHTAHSDGQCASQSGNKVPCPVFLTIEAAARRGLDFIAISDHNTTSQYDAMRELQPYFDKVLLIPAREITTFYGHMNLLGTTSYLDFRVGSQRVPDTNMLLRNAQRLGALVSINHPGAPTGELCMGCGWTPKTAVDMGLITAVEAVNGGSELEGIDGVPFWDKQLNEGHRLTGIGGSDNHNALSAPDRPSAVGNPTTVVYATELSIPAILDGIRAGHVAVDATASQDRLLTMTGQTADTTAQMGDSLDMAQQTSVDFDVHETGADNGRISLVEDGHVLEVPITSNSTTGTLHTRWTSDGRRHWFRPQVNGPDGKLWMIGNPIYINWGRAPASRAQGFVSRNSR